MKFLNLDSIDEIPTNLPPDCHAQLQLKRELARRIVDFVWTNLPEQDLKVAIQAGSEDPFSIPDDELECIKCFEGDGVFFFFSYLEIQTCI